MSNLKIHLTGVVIIAAVTVALLLLFSPTVRAVPSFLGTRLSLSEASHCVTHLEPVPADSIESSKSTDLGCYDTFEEAISVANGDQPPSETAPLSGTRWKLLAFADQVLPEQPKMVVEFKDGSLSLEGGCNSVGASYELNDDQITITSSEGTLVDCSDEMPEIPEIEEAFLTALQTFESYSISDDELRIRYADGDLLLRRVD